MFMFEKAITGSRRYWVWILCLAALIGAGFLAYLRHAHDPPLECR
jgi:molybdopterin-containing oxidoreductase family membrane subunit